MTSRTDLKIHRQKQPPGHDGIRFSLRKVVAKITEGRLHPHVRSWSMVKLHEAGNPRGAVARARVLLDALRKQSGWVPDPKNAEFIAGAHLTLGDGKDVAPFFVLGDCFAEGTLLLSEGHSLIPVESVKEGTRIWGLDRWSTVHGVAYKGILPIDAIQLNNGSTLKLTADHHVYVLDCTTHPMLDDEAEPKALPPDAWWRRPDEARCSCADRVEKRVRVSELREGMVLPTPTRIPFGTETIDPDRALVEGLYVADGWSENNRFAISGKDGCPKEEQKRLVEAICNAKGISTRWHSRYIAVNDADWALRMQRMGGHAPEKHFLSINLDEASAAASLRGVMADSGKNTKGDQRTFTTTSRELAIQVRLLHKMFGITCGYRYIENHGGLGKHPVYRLGTRGNTRNDGRAPWLLRIKSIDREVLHAPCWDITTDDHRVYLPEHDVTVSQCDDLTVAWGASVLAPLLYLASVESVGVTGAVVGHAYNPERHIEHVLGAIYDEGRWWYADPSIDLPFGECKRPTRELVYLVPGRETDVAICDADVCLAPGGRASGPPREPSGGDFVSVDGIPGLDDVCVLHGVGDDLPPPPPLVLRPARPSAVRLWL